jgi:ERCC4-type nuclease
MAPAKSPAGNGLPAIIIDTREKLPWLFAPEVAYTLREGLSAGDYSLRGFEDRVSVERKELNDLVGTLFFDWVRFKKELRKLAGYELACIAVEADIRDVADRKYTADIHPNSILGRCHAIYADYGIPTFFWGERVYARAMGERFLLMAHKRLNGNISENVTAV